MSSSEYSFETCNNAIFNGTSSPRDTDTDSATAETIGDQPNGVSSSKTQLFCNANDENRHQPLKIIGHLKNIEKINDKRRFFLTNTLTESVVASNGSSDDKTETGSTTTTTTTTSKSAEQYEDKINNTIQDQQNGINGKKTIVHENFKDKPNNEKSKTIPLLPPLKSPVGPPPKPPMLSRTCSLGVGDRRPISLPLTPTNTPVTALPPNGPITLPTSPTAIQTLNPIKAPLANNVATVLRRVERPLSILPDASKQISMNHYERLIEELRCPGCASPMKSPILLCQTGHSICSQCTRVLMMCPLCKEPFTQMRSRTIEALCAKAHFRCCNAAGGCNVRLQTDLLAWHEKQCIYKPMKCFMGRVWGDCQWTGREIDWKEHLEKEHGNRLFQTNEIDLVWDMTVRNKSLTGYYVFDIFDELFNFYQIYDNERVLFTMTCTSTPRERKHHFAYEVAIIHPGNEALAITQKFPVHSEYDKDILAEGTCVSITFNDLAKFIDNDKILNYRVRLLEVPSPRKTKHPRYSINASNGMHPIDFQQTQIEGANLKGVPNQSIVTRKVVEIPFVDTAPTPSSVETEMEAGAVDLNDEDVKMRKRFYSNEAIARESGSDSDPEFEAYIAKKWGTPQMHFNRKFLTSTSPDSGSSNGSRKNEIYDRFDDKSSIASRNTSYARKLTNTLRKSFRSLKTPIIELKPLAFVKRSPEKKSS